MSKQRSQREIALQHFLKYRRVGIQPTLRGEKRPPLHDLLIKIDEQLNPEENGELPDWDG